MNPFLKNKEKFPLNYMYTVVDILPKETATFKDNPYFVKSNFHQTKRFTPFGFYKPIAIGIKMKNNSEL